MTDTTDWRAEAERLRGERDELAARTRELTLYAAGVEAERNELAERHLSSETIARLMPPATISKANVERWDRAALHAFARSIERELIARPAPAAAPERAGHALQELTALERELLEALQGAYSLAIGHTATYQHQHQLAAPHPTHAKILSQSRAAIAKAIPAAADEPARADSQPRPTCSSSGLLGASSGVGRECGMWIEGVCTSPDPCQHQRPASAAAPERAEPAANELPTRCTECGQLGWHKFGCGHVAHERGPRVTAQSSESTSRPRGKQ